MQQKPGQSEVFLNNARHILDAAENVYFSTGSLEETSILIAPEGGIHLVSGSDWSLESLRVHHGARMAYRVSQRDGRVQLEGRAGSRTCLFEAEKPDGAARLLLANTRHYDLLPTQLLPAAAAAHTKAHAYGSTAYGSTVMRTVSVSVPPPADLAVST